MSRVLRRFEASDTDAVLRLIHRTIDDCYFPTYPPRAIDFFKRFHSRDAIVTRGGEGYVVVVDDDGEIVATGALVDAEVSGVFVDVAWQGRGLGQAVMDELERHALRSGNSSVGLSVSLPSRGFYEHRGYLVVEECSLDVGGGQRLDYWQAVKPLSAESESADTA